MRHSEIGLLAETRFLNESFLLKGQTCGWAMALGAATAQSGLG